MKVKGLDNFIGYARTQFPKEAAGFLFSRHPYSPDEEWLIIPVKNVSDDPEHKWKPDKTDVISIKKTASGMGYVKIGNIHTHAYKLNLGTLDEQVQPSELDLKFAKRFNDIVRIILLISEFAMLGVICHDKFGNKLDVLLIDSEVGEND